MFYLNCRASSPRSKELKILRILIILGVLGTLTFLAACRPAAPEEASSTIAAVVSGESPTPRPTRTTASTAEPTAVPPSMTATTTPTATTAPSPTPVPTRQPTAAPVLTGREKPPSDDLLRKEIFRSPDDRWTVEAIRTEKPQLFADGEFNYAALTVSSTDGTLIWPVVAGWRPHGLGAAFPRPLDWSPDGRYFYFSNVPLVDGCVFYVNGSDLWRVDLESGQALELLPDSGLVVAVAPDGERVAYRAYGGRGLVVRHLLDGEETEIELPLDGDIGSMAWSADGRLLLVSVGQEICGPPEDRTGALVAVDGETGEAAVLLGPDDRLFAVKAALPEGSFALERPDGTTWGFDPAQGESSLKTVLLKENLAGFLPGMIFERESMLFRVGDDGRPVELVENPIAVSPGTNRYILRLNPGGRLVLRDSEGGGEKIIGGEYFATFFHSWDRPGHIVLGIWDGEDDQGPNLGHLALYDVEKGRLTVLDGEALMFAEAHLSPDGRRIAYDRVGEGRLYDLVNGESVPFDPAAFQGWTAGTDVRLGSGIWSPNGARIAWIIGGGRVLNGSWGLATAIFDLTAQTVQIFQPYDPVGRGGWPAAPRWSPDGSWLVVEQWGIARADTGLFALEIKSGQSLRLTPYLSRPVWYDAQTLLFTGQEGAGKMVPVRAWLFDTRSGEMRELATPEGFARFLQN